MNKSQRHNRHPKHVYERDAEKQQFEQRLRALTDHKKLLLDDLGKHIVTTSKFQAYIKEAEHQDGLEYWANFATPTELLSDYFLYSSNEGVVHEDAPDRHEKPRAVCKIDFSLIGEDTWDEDEDDGSWHPYHPSNRGDQP
jgi:hypothetical protein